MSTLYVVSTPIGNLQDVTLRALEVLREVAVIAVEDTRHTGKLLQRHGISTRMVSYNEHNKRERQHELLERLAVSDLALVSDAGTPTLSDPGYELVKAAINAGHTVSPVPGPSAPMAALAASGLPTDSFVFVGFLPRKAAARRTLLTEMATERRTILAFEAPHRLREALEDIEDAMGSGRPVAVCRELTKLHEEIVRGDVADVLEHFESVEPRGEFTLVIGGATVAWDEEEVRRAMQRHLAAGMQRSKAAQRVAAEAGWPRSEVYKLAEGAE